MLKNITLGQYFPGESLIHRLDPRTKLLATIALIAIVFVSQGFAGFLLIASFVIACAASTGIHLKFLIKGLKPIFFIIIFTFVLNLFFQTSGNVLVRLGPVRVTDQGLRMAAFIMSSFCTPWPSSEKAATFGARASMSARACPASPTVIVP